MRAPSLACVDTLALVCSSSRAAEDLTGFYYATPDFSGPAQVRVDAQLAFQWSAGPAQSDLPADEFTVRWLGELIAPAAETLTLIVRSDDGVRVWLDGALVVSDWVARSPSESRYTFQAQGGRRYLFRMDYFEATGGAEVSLSWESLNRSCALVPSANLIPLLQPAIARIPTSSPVSPVCLNGLRRPEAKAAVSVNGKAQKCVDLPETSFFANVPLAAGKSTVVTVGDQSGAIAWAATTLIGDHDLAIRVGDALLLTAPVGVTYQVIRNSGVMGAARNLKAGATKVERFNDSGFHSIIAFDAVGVEVGRIDVDVIAVGFDGPIACEVGFRREKGVDITGGAAARVEFVAADESLLEVATKEPTDYGARLFLTARQRGTPTVVARLAESKAIIGFQTIDEFTVQSDALLGAVRNPATDAVGVSMVIKPWISGLTAQFSIFAHSTTFVGVGKAFDIGSDTVPTFIDPVSGEKCGLFAVELSMPASESMYCLRLTMDQHSSHGTAVGGKSFNGAACDFDVDVLSIEQGDTAQHPLVIWEGAKNPDAEHHGKHKQEHSIALTGPGINQLKLANDPVNGATFDCVKEDNWRPLVTAKEKAKTGFYDVTIHGTLFEKKIEIYTECKFELTAKEDKAGKELLYRCFPGTSVVITAKLIKKGSRDPGTHRLVVTGPSDPPSFWFDLACPKKEGQSVSTDAIDVFKRTLAAGSYEARIVNTTKAAIFTVTDRVTINNHLFGMSGKMGSVMTGKSETKPKAVNIKTEGAGNSWTVTIKAPFAVLYKDAGPIENLIAAGKPREWPSAEREKAPSDEIEKWNECVTYVQRHEEGHVTTWNNQKVPGRVETATAVGTGATTAATLAAAIALLAPQIDVINTLPVQIKDADDSVQGTYHTTPQGGNNFAQFKLPGRGD